MLFLMALVAVSAAPGREAEALGVRLARTSGIATIAPMMVQKDLTELAKEDPSLSSAQRERLRQIGSAEGQAGIELVVAALGASYAKHLSLRDLRALVKQNERFQENHRCANVQRERQILRTALISVRRRY
jgi:hypothetical protein